MALVIEESSIIQENGEDNTIIQTWESAVRFLFLLTLLQGVSEDQKKVWVDLYQKKKSWSEDLSLKFLPDAIPFSTLKPKRPQTIPLTNQGAGIKQCICHTFIQDEEHNCSGDCKSYLKCHYVCKGKLNKFTNLILQYIKRKQMKFILLK